MTASESSSAGSRDRLRLALIVVAGLLASLVLIDPLTPVISHALNPPSVTVTGVVFADRNANGRQDKGEGGIKGVSVSDGAAIVHTDRKGRYRLNTDPERRITDLVFVSQPSGYSVGKDEYSTPRFYRDLGQLADGDERVADFALTPTPASRGHNFTFANIADPHANPGNPLRTTEAWAAQMTEIGSTS